jgi:hypothetical protein
MSVQNPKRRKRPERFFVAPFSAPDECFCLQVIDIGEVDMPFFLEISSIRYE